MRTAFSSLNQHIDTILAHHLVAKILCKEILQQVNTSWWTWFSSTVTDFYNKLVNNAAPGGQPQKGSQGFGVSGHCFRCCEDVRGTTELRKARQPGMSAELAGSGGQTVGRFLYATLQEIKRFFFAVVTFP